MCLCSPSWGSFSSTKVRDPKVGLQGNPEAPPSPPRETRGQRGKLAAKGDCSERASDFPILSRSVKRFYPKTLPQVFSLLCHKSSQQL